MSLRDEIRAKIRLSDGSGWRELVQHQPEALNLMIDIAGHAVRQGKNPEALLSFIDQVLRKKQHINDYDLIHHLRQGVA